MRMCACENGMICHANIERRVVPKTDDCCIHRLRAGQPDTAGRPAPAGSCTAERRSSLQSCSCGGRGAAG